MEKLMFYSTNKNAEPASFRTALLKGQAPDYGLYLPLKIPRFSAAEIRSLKGKDYAGIAFEVVRKFLHGQVPERDLRRLTREVYDFDVPLEKVRDGFYIMRLDRGPTASFKDFAAVLMARLLRYFSLKEKRKLTVLVATSGDTGGAIARAFHGLKNINVVVLFPEKEVTGRQRRQMTTLRGNVFAVAVRGKFDDCQAMVKTAFNDPDLASLNLTSANSINFGRLLPQAVYYFYAYLKTGCRKTVFSVPSGNFGNLMGGVLAREMGLPVERFIAAVNENDEFPRFLETGEYRPVVPSRKCSSNAMNVGNPSNLARLFDLYGGWLRDERDRKGRVVKRGVLKIKPDIERMRRDFVSFAITEKEVDATILKYYRNYGTMLEPHGAVAVAAAEKSGLKGLIIALETADPAKFPEKTAELLHLQPRVPGSLASLDAQEEKFKIIGNDYAGFKKHLTAIQKLSL